ncbi:MAG: nucleotidyl transferase AbiEii/AbiGii toxin family protein [Solirubrobacterales bacterium]|nr:nucleotidyl transferase AbiEii/AbiGii toxin family protein [Solirubrobacterales bacterium]
MIPAANVAAWRRQAPWPEDNQVEQDLILSRLMVEIAKDDLLGTELALRGETCLHKLHLSAPLRYSEDLDYVHRTHSGVGPILDALRELAVRIGLDDRGTDRTGQMAHASFDATPTSGVGRMRVKVEINIAETDPCFPRIAIPLAVESPWWQGGAEIATFTVEELLGTKLRALYQRSKGRDLFDLWHVLTDLGPDEAKIVTALGHYMGAEAFTFPELSLNLSAKLADRDFRADLPQLVTSLPETYDPDRAANVIMERLGPRLRNAPDQAAIRDGAWRR